MAPPARVPESRDFVSVYVTAASEDDAARIARALLERRLVACANIVPARSLYWWNGAIEESREAAMFMKTRRALVPEVEKAVAELHDYDVPCCVAFDLEGGLASYLAWIDAETRAISRDGSE